MKMLDPIPPDCSADDFKAMMRRLAASVAVLSTWHEGRALGLTATAVCSLTAEPPSLAVCVNRSAEAYPAIVASRRLGVSILTEDQAELATRFAGGAHRGEAKFDGHDWRLMPDGPPLLADALVAFDCRLEQFMDYGTHTIMACRVRAITANPSLSPLIYLDRTFLAARPLGSA
jgi:flavin reductase (DIM6/NTAB) family NADH-FMN oxidoreductase RutF